MYKCRRQFLGSCNSNSAHPPQYSVQGDAKFSDSISMTGGVCWKAVAAFALAGYNMDVWHS